MTTTVASPLRDDLFRSGYVVVPDVIDPGGVLQPVLDEYAEVLAADFAVDEALIYGDYYYMQALTRLHEPRMTSTQTTHR